MPRQFDSQWFGWRPMLIFRVPGQHSIIAYFFKKIYIWGKIRCRQVYYFIYNINSNCIFPMHFVCSNFLFSFCSTKQSSLFSNSKMTLVKLITHEGSYYSNNLLQSIQCTSQFLFYSSYIYNTFIYLLSII